MILSPGIFVKKILFNKSIYFGYCITLYLLLSFIFIEVTSTIVAEILAESFASVLLAYWIAKMITRFKEVRTFITPVVFLYVHLAAMDDSVYILNGETEGVPFTMWTLGIALILFIIAQLSLKIGMITTLLFFPALFFAWPTKGISIIAYIAFLFFQGYIKAKTRMHHANKIHSAKDVASGNGRLPSWAGNKDKVVEFLYSVNKLAERNGVPVLCYLV
jgi:hypothetical protein